MHTVTYVISGDKFSIFSVWTLSWSFIASSYFFIWWLSGIEESNSLLSRWIWPSFQLEINPNKKIRKEKGKEREGKKRRKDDCHLDCECNCDNDHDSGWDDSDSMMIKDKRRKEDCRKFENTCHNCTQMQWLRFNYEILETE